MQLLRAGLSMPNKAQQTKSFGHVEGIAHRGPPRNVFAAGELSLASEEIDSECLTRRRRKFAQSRPGNFHGAIPNFAFFIDARCNLKIGVPGPAFFVMRFRQIDVEVYPFSLGLYFKFLVTANVLEVRAYENLRHIPIPKLIGLGCCSWVRLQK